jgi:capsular exopolysaccharide synthesis family protein
MGEILDALKKAERDAPKQPDREGLPLAAPPAPHRESASTSGYPVRISREEDKFSSAREVLLNPFSEAAEAYRKLALKTRAEMNRRQIRSLAITGPLREEGKTTTVCNLALALASMAGDKRVALVCLDLRRPNVATQLGVHPEVGIEDVIRGIEPLDRACAHTEISGLDLYLPLCPVEEPHGLLASPAFQQIISTLESRYDLILVDTPPVLLVPDAVIIAETLGGWAIVIRHGRTRVRSLEEAMASLPKEKFLGAILNEKPSSRSNLLYGGYGYTPYDEGSEDGKRS